MLNFNMSYKFTIFNKITETYELVRYYPEENLNLAEELFEQIGNDKKYINGFYNIMLIDINTNAILKQYDTEIDI